MEKSKLNFFIQTKGKFFPQEKIYTIREKLEKTDDRKADMLNVMEFKNPTTITLLAVFLGALGIDRFQTGSTGIGVLKIVGFFVGAIAYAIALNVRGMQFLALIQLAYYIWLIVEMFTASKRTKNYNYQKLIEALGM